MQTPQWETQHPVRKRQAVTQKCYTTMQLVAQTHTRLTITNISLCSAEQQNLQPSHSTQRRAAPRRSQCTEKNIFLHLPVNFRCVLWCGPSLCLREFKAAGERKRKDNMWESDDATLRWNKAVFCGGCTFRGASFHQLMLNPAFPPSFFKTVEQQNLFITGRKKRQNLLLIIAGPHGNSHTKRSHSSLWRF